MTRQLREQAYANRLTEIEQVQHQLITKVSHLEAGMGELSEALEIVRDEERTHFAEVQDQLKTAAKEYKDLDRAFRAGWQNNMQTRLMIFILFFTFVIIFYSIHF